LGTANVTTGRTRTLRSASVFSTDLASPSGQPHPRVVRPRTRLLWSARFHCAKHLNEGVDRVRRAEHRDLRARGDTRLTGTKYAWLRHPDHFTRPAWRAFAALRTSTLKVARAWALKETAADLCEYRYVGAARKFFRRWYFWATHSRLPPMIEKARMLKTHLPNVLTYLRHRITNATAEGLNSTIQWIRYTARGFRNRENFKTAIYFHCGKLDLYPH